MTTRAATALRIARALGLDPIDGTWLCLGRDAANVLLTFRSRSERDVALHSVVAQRCHYVLKADRAVDPTRLSVVVTVAGLDAIAA